MSGFEFGLFKCVSLDNFTSPKPVVTWPKVDYAQSVFMAILLSAFMAAIFAVSSGAEQRERSYKCMMIAYRRMHLDTFKRTRRLAGTTDIFLCRLAMPISRSLMDMATRSFKLSQLNSAIASNFFYAKFGS